MIWIPVSEKEEKELAKYGITEGEYPASQSGMLIVAPVSEDEANATLKLIRENGVLKFGLTDEEYSASFYPWEFPKGIDILSYEDLTGKIKDRNIAFMSIF